VQPVLELKGIVKRFPGVVANDSIDLTLNKGEIHAILGENGAGKSTLMNVLYGLIAPDSGTIRINGEEVRFASPADAIARGIGMVHQHFMLIPVMTVTENVMLGQESCGPMGWLKPAAVAAEISAIGEHYGLKVDPQALVGNLSVGEQQRVEIIKVLYRQAQILILDEPTAVLTPQEVADLGETMRALANSGHSLLFITHKLKEALAWADRITVLRAGKVVATRRPAETSEQELASLMVGREVELAMAREPARLGEPVLTVRDLHVTGEHDLPAVRGVSFEVRAGEVLGIAGVQGNGQTELVEALAGLRPVTAGSVTIAGVDTTRASPRHITSLGVGHIPEDRQHDGLILPFTVEDNLVLTDYHQTPFSRRGLLNRPRIRERAEKLVEAFDIRASSVTAPVKSLSGGNQQKVIVARTLSRSICLLLAANPTRGVDVGSVEYIHRRILQARRDGVAVLLISTELDEVLALSDRVAVMYHGQITAILAADEVDRSRLGLLMAGAVA
jgi:ABC-type uncharacterized transport system ATPase subunit